MFPLRQFCTSILLLFPLFSFAQKEKPQSFEDKLLYGGCWFVPHNSGVNIRFTEFSNFQVQDVDKETGNEVTYTGKYLLDGSNLWLLYNDKPRQKLLFTKGEGADNAYYIKGYPARIGTAYFVHGTCE